MKLKYLILPGLLLGAALTLSAANTSAQSAPEPTAGTKLTGGLLSPRGMKIGPDGMIYVAEAGSGGDIAGADEAAGNSGFSGRISKIDPATGTRTTVADKLPSNATTNGDSVGPADVDFISGQLYYLHTHGGEYYGLPDSPTGIYKVNEDGSVDLVADIGQYNLDNPIDDLVNNTQVDIEVGGNPYAMVVRDGAFLVTDGNQNQVMRVTTGGVITRIAEFHGHPVATGIASASSGPLYVTTLGQFPFAAEDGEVHRIGYPTGNISLLGSGFGSMTDVEFGPGGQLYAINFGDQNTELSDENPVPWTFGSGKVIRVDTATGALTPIVTGFTFTTSIIFSGDTAYVANNGVTIPGLNDGEIWKIENVSSLAALPEPAPPAPPPAPAPTPRSGIGAPNTGTGASGGGESWLAALALLAITGTALVVAGKRARSTHHA